MSRDHMPILPPPRFVIATIDGRGGIPGLKSGHRVGGSSKVEGRPKAGQSCPSSPGCCTATNIVSSSGVKIGPHISAPIGHRKKCLDVPRRAPSASMFATPTTTFSSGGVKSVPDISAPIGHRKKCLDVPRSAPSVSIDHTPSDLPVVTPELPSVVIHSRPMLSTAQLSGMPNQPSFVVAEEKVAPTAATDGSPHLTRISHRDLVRS